MKKTGCVCPQCGLKTDESPCGNCGYDFPDSQQDEEEEKEARQVGAIKEKHNELYSYIQEGIAKARELEEPIARGYILSLVSGRKGIKSELKIAALSLAKADVRLSLALLELKQEEGK